MLLALVDIGPYRLAALDSLRSLGGCLLICDARDVRRRAGWTSNAHEGERPPWRASSTDAADRGLRMARADLWPSV